MSAENDSLVDEVLKSLAPYPIKIRDPIIAAMRAVDRGNYLDKLGYFREAYNNSTAEHPSQKGVIISPQPSSIMLHAEILSICGGQRVLQIGAETGYSAAINACIIGPSGRLFVLDFNPLTMKSAKKNVEKNNPDLANIEFVIGDIQLGCPDHKPFDRIYMPLKIENVDYQRLQEQLSEKGIMMVLHPSNGMHSTYFLRKNDKRPTF